MSIWWKRSLLGAVAVVTAVWMLSPGQAAGWSTGGHRVVANIAYDRLTEEERGNIVNILRQHKDFKKHFTTPMAGELKGSSAEDEARWIFLQASIWPDLIARRPWHFVNLPFFLSETDEVALKNDIKPNLSTKVPKNQNKKTMEQTLNCIQAVKVSIRELKDAHTTVSEKAEYYCWLIHIVGDMHQPMHSTSLVSRARFNEDAGDKGGNGIPTKPGSSLHSYWDGLHGKEQSLKKIRERSKIILADQVMTKAAESAMSNHDPVVWIAESHKIAKADAYTKDILDAVANGEHNPKSELMRVTLDDAYQKRAHEIADRRVAEAGFRLAEILKLVD